MPSHTRQNWPLDWWDTQKNSRSHKNPQNSLWRIWRVQEWIPSANGWVCKTQKEKEKEVNADGRLTEQQIKDTLSQIEKILRSSLVVVECQRNWLERTNTRGMIERYPLPGMQIIITTKGVITWKLRRVSSVLAVQLNAMSRPMDGPEKPGTDATSVAQKLLFPRHQHER